MKPLCSGMAVLLAVVSAAMACEWETLETEGAPVPRHEAGLIEHDGLLYLLGGRRIEPVSVFDPQSNRWRNASKPPIEGHHFQPVIHDGKIHVVCAMTGGFPNETPLERVLMERLKLPMEYR